MVQKAELELGQKERIWVRLFCIRNSALQDGRSHVRKNNVSVMAAARGGVGSDRQDSGPKLCDVWIGVRSCHPHSRIMSPVQMTKWSLEKVVLKVTKSTAMAGSQAARVCPAHILSLSA